MDQPATSPLRLTEWTSCGGCAAKFGATLVTELVAGLADGAKSDLLVGLAPFDDAAVFRVADDLAVVSTTDFFPPLVDDPDDFGAIAAANACSDVFAMGGRVTIALNLAAFPEHLPRDAIAAILEGAARTVTEAGGTVAGGHTIRSEEPIFGLAVQGLVHPDRILTKGGARPGDALLLSKALGTGIVLASDGDEHEQAAVDSMRPLNRAASEALIAAGQAARRGHGRHRLRLAGPRVGGSRPLRLPARDRRGSPPRCCPARWMPPARAFARAGTRATAST